MPLSKQHDVLSRRDVGKCLKLLMATREVEQMDLTVFFSDGGNGNKTGIILVYYKSTSGSAAVALPNLIRVI